MTLTNIYANLYFARNKKFSIFIIIRENTETDCIYRERIIIIFLKAEKSLRFWSIIEEKIKYQNYDTSGGRKKTAYYFLKKFFLIRIFDIYYSRKQVKIVSKKSLQEFFIFILSSRLINNLIFLYLNTHTRTHIVMQFFFHKIYFSVLYVDLVVIFFRYMWKVLERTIRDLIPVKVLHRFQNLGALRYSY